VIFVPCPLVVFIGIDVLTPELHPLYLPQIVGVCVSLFWAVPLICDGNEYQTKLTR